MIRTRKKNDSGETTATNASAVIDTLIGDVMTMIATKNAGTVIAGTSMNEMTPRNMTDVKTIDVKGTVISGGTRSAGFFAEKSIGRLRGITRHRYQITGKQKTIVG